MENNSVIHKDNYQPNPIECHKCHEVFSDRKSFYSHNMILHHKMGGQDDLQDIPFIIPPWENNQGEVINQPLRECYEMHEHIILSQHKTSQIKKIYNFPLDNSINLDRLRAQANEIFLNEQYVFRLNICFELFYKT